jgi:hypothetical protein
MATWPSASKASTTNLDSGTDSPASARADLKTNVDNVNSVIDMFNIDSPSNNQILKYNNSNSRFELATNFDPASPGAIGSSTASSGAFTSISSSTNATLKDIRETVYSLTYASTITPDVANGTIQKVTLTGNVTFSAFSNPVAGQSMTLIVTQDGTGSRTLTSTMKWSGGTKTLSTAAGSIDIISVFYDGTDYYASLGKAFA